MHCCKLSSLAHILVLSASHHFFLLHGQPQPSSPSYRWRSTSSSNMSVQFNTSTTHSISYPPYQSPPWPKDEFPSLLSSSSEPSPASPPAPPPPSPPPASPPASPPAPPPASSPPVPSQASPPAPPPASSPPVPSQASPPPPPPASSPPVPSQASPPPPPQASPPPVPSQVSPPPPPPVPSPALPPPPPLASPPPVPSQVSPPPSLTKPPTLAPPPPLASPPPVPSQVSPPPSLTKPPTLAPPPESSPAQSPLWIIDRRKRTTQTGLIVGSVIGSVVLIVVLFTCFFVWRKRRTRESAQLQLQPQPQPQPEPPKVANEEEVPLSFAPSSPSNGLRLGRRTFTYEELESATNGFSDSNFLGEGGFGIVHKGVLPDDEQTCVAIKQLKSGIQQGQREFLTEIEIINRVNHKHLVSLVGYCIDESRSKMMFVYEFIPNKTVAFHLHEKGTETIDWKTRMKIAIGSAKGLAYLHEQCHPKIIHRDIKASNILIDDDFEPKVADFGLARFSLESKVMTRIVGSFGYLAPEYAASGRLTEKSDVFSFGVVLLELITGKKPVDDTENFPNGSMVEWATLLFSEALNNRNFEGIADARLKDDYEVEEMFCMVSCAANCVRYSDMSRPRMSQVVQALEGVICLDNDLTEENLTRRLLSKDLRKLRKMEMGSYTHSTTSTSTSTFSSAASKTSSSSGSKIFK